MMNFIKSIFTEPDNKTWCIVKILTGLGAITFMIATVLHMYMNKSFDPQSFGIGFGSLMAGSGGGMKLKPDTPI